jgi:YoeB-like toxin of bacterial type II toxin-antitoxin system
MLSVPTTSGLTLRRHIVLTYGLRCWAVGGATAAWQPGTRAVLGSRPGPWRTGPSWCDSKALSSADVQGEPLKHGLHGYWSRRIADEHRLVYKLSENEIRIAVFRYHYAD